MAKMYYGSIDLNKIDKSKIVTTDKNGKPFENGAKYLNIVQWLNDTPDQYGNVLSIQESLSKEEREQGAKPNYIGNLKANEQTTTQTAPTTPPQTNNAMGGEYDPDLGF
jgi:hypothetical protein